MVNVLFQTFLWLPNKNESKTVGNFTVNLEGTSNTKTVVKSKMVLYHQVFIEFNDHLRLDTSLLLTLSNDTSLLTLSHNMNLNAKKSLAFENTHSRLL